jgi:hypothetical protein
MKKAFSVLALIGAVSLLAGSPTMAQEEGGGGYQEAAVADGGTVSGKVTFKGTAPAPKTFELAKFPNQGFCGKISDGKGNRVVQEVRVKDGTLQDVVVSINGISKGKPFKFEGTDIQSDTCRFLVKGGPSDLVGVVVKKNELRVENMDADPNDPKAVTGVLHNPHGYEVAGASLTTLFNKPLPDKGQKITQKVILRKKESFMKVECDQHNFMNAFFYPVSNPYHAIVGADGSFTIDGVPPGEYEVTAWHPILGVEKQKVTVAAKGKASANFTLAAK